MALFWLPARLCPNHWSFLRRVQLCSHAWSGPGQSSPIRQPRRHVQASLQMAAHNRAKRPLGSSLHERCQMTTEVRLSFMTKWCGGSRPDDVEHGTPGLTDLRPAERSKQALQRHFARAWIWKPTRGSGTMECVTALRGYLISGPGRWF